MASAAQIKKQTREFMRARSAFFKAARAAHIATKTLQYGRVGVEPRIVEKLMAEAIRSQSVGVVATARLAAAKANVTAAWRSEREVANGEP